MSDRLISHTQQQWGGLLVLFYEQVVKVKKAGRVLTKICISIMVLTAVMLGLVRPVSAGEVEIVDVWAELQGVDSQRAGHQLWRFNVTLRHADSGWKHYADGWQVVDSKNNVLGDRVLHHPHENEQPFTRGLSGVSLPVTTQSVMIRAHDSVHGWADQRFTVMLDKP
ncbi:MAG: hypothetical protein V7707_07935 [Motiliproteus sp.]